MLQQEGPAAPMGNINYACHIEKTELRLLILSSASCSYNRDDEDVIKAMLALHDLQHQPQLNIFWLQFLLPHLSGGMTPCLLLVRFICETDNDWETWEFTVSLHPAFPLSVIPISINALSCWKCLVRFKSETVAGDSNCCNPQLT